MEGTLSHGDGNQIKMKTKTCLIVNTQIHKPIHSILPCFSKCKKFHDKSFTPKFPSFILLRNTFKHTFLPKFHVSTSISSVAVRTMTNTINVTTMILLLLLLLLHISLSARGLTRDRSHFPLPELN